ncbi:MAG: phytoene desaturase [Deltaproteobacteria bacterium]|nr:MAG: phytoene desaturase [Deltaproteobacteria bacterium]
MSETRKTAIIIGSGIGGLSLGIRLQAAGYDTTIVEALDKPGGRAYVRQQDGFTFDMGPTVLTVPHFIEELFALERDEPGLDALDFPDEILPKTAHATELRIREGWSSGPRTHEYVKIRPILPFYRIYFDDGTYFDYDGDPESTRRQIEAIEPADLEGYERFHRDARAIFERGFLELGYTYFGDPWSMIKVIPDLFKLDAVRSLFGFTARYFKSDKLRQVFSFETLLIGGNPLRVPAIYAMIHFVEKTWGIHFAMGGTGALVDGFVRKYEELGGTMRYDASVDEILIEKRTAKGVRLHTGEELHADLVVSNADYATTYMKLIDKKHRTWNPDWKVKALRYSMSLVVIYFGFEKREGETLDLQHHNIILGPRYEELLTDIFDRKKLADDFSQYLHIPTLTDPSLAPEGHHAAYTLIPVPHNGSGLNWDEIGEGFVDKVLGMLDDEGFIPGLRERVVTKSFITPDYFEGKLQAYLGNAFGVEPRLEHSAWFRPHNRSEDITNLYLVGASAQPGAGTPSVMMSAKMTCRAIVEDHGVQAEKPERSEISEPAAAK